MDTAIDFDDPDIAQRIEALGSDEVDRLPFGAVRVDPAGLVAFYSARERALSGMGQRPVVGLAWFTQVAPCMDAPAFRGRVEAALASRSLDLRLEHLGDFADRTRALVVRAVSARDGGFWMFLKRR